MKLPKSLNFEFAVWQMVNLCIDPKKVFRHSSYQNSIFRKTTNQSHYARDDPTFVILEVFFLFLTAIAYSITFNVDTAGKFIKLVLSSIFIDFLALGVAIATCTWLICNRFLVQTRSNIIPVSNEMEFGGSPMATNGSSSNSSDKVEWLYAFDIHCNAFFPVFCLLYVGQFVLFPLLSGGGFFSSFVSNTLFLLALTYYHYLTFLGYNAVSFVQSPTLFLYPIAILVFAYLIALLSGFNATHFVLWTVYFP